MWFTCDGKILFPHMVPWPRTLGTKIRNRSGTRTWSECTIDDMYNSVQYKCTFITRVRIPVHVCMYTCTIVISSCGSLYFIVTHGYRYSNLVVLLLVLMYWCCTGIAMSYSAYRYCNIQYSIKHIWPYQYPGTRVRIRVYVLKQYITITAHNCGVVDVGLEV